MDSGQVSFLCHSRTVVYARSGDKGENKQWVAEGVGRQSSVRAAVVREAGNLSGPMVVERPSFRKGAWVKQVLNSRSR